jgi:hypothetical protein
MIVGYAVDNDLLHLPSFTAAVEPLTLSLGRGPMRFRVLRG